MVLGLLVVKQLISFYVKVMLEWLVLVIPCLFGVIPQLLAGQLGRLLR